MLRNCEIGFAKRLRLLGNHFCIGGADGLKRLHDAGAHFARLGMAANRMLRKDQLAVDGDVKDAAGARDQLPTADEVFDFTLVQNFVRQTDGLGLVSSSRAILDDNVHSTFLHETTPSAVSILR